MFLAILAFGLINESMLHAAKGVAQSTKTENKSGQLDEAVTKSISSFFEALAQKDVAAAYDQLTKGTVIAEKAEEIAQLKTKTRQALDLFGDVQGSEIVRVEKVGGHLLGATCLSVGKKLPLRWRFYFYRSEAEWKLIDIRVDDRLVEMFDAPAKP